jgi:crotonobetaine/carnitine-CoA ligase
MAVAKADIPRVLRGNGLDLGRYATRFPLEDRTILHVAQLQAKERGDKPWLIFDAKDVLTFGEAWRLTHKIAAAIRDTVGIGKHVGLYLRNQIEFMTAEMGAMAAPGVAVPLNADARGPLLQSQIERADLEILIARIDLLEWLEGLQGLGQLKLIVACGDGNIPKKVRGVPVIHWEDWLKGKPDRPGGDLPKYDDMAVIAFTSGTTGRAKGVVHTHHYWQLFSAILADSLERKEDDVLTTPLPIYHGGALHLIANGALHPGCTGHLQIKFSPSRFWPDAARDGATYGFLLGPLAAMVRKETKEVPKHRLTQGIYCLPSPPDRPEWEKHFNARILRQGWAMTEIFPLPMRPEMMPDVPEDTIGYPVKWMDYGVVDEKDNMVAPGQAGELVWRSNIPYGMFSGYYKEPEMTLEAFRNFWFHTGDAASYEPDGMLRFRGRLKDRIRRRGEMVSGAEIEYVALQHQAVLEAAAYGVPYELGEEDIKLDIVLKDPVEVKELHEWLAKNLPRFMVPRYVEIVDEFPKTPSLRIEKYKLKSQPANREGVFDAGERFRVN